MAADLSRIIADLTGFYDFSGKDVVYVGAGGGRLLPALRGARRLQAVDADAPSLDALRDAAEREGLLSRLSLNLGDYAGLDLRGDVVYFEFCLHEMPDPDAALRRARTCAPQTLVLDHLPGSPWAALTAETEKVASAWEALSRERPTRREHFEGIQSFRDHAELRARLAALGEGVLSRLEPYRGLTGLRIPMPYGAALLER